MDTKTKLSQALKQAMRDRDEDRKWTLRLALAAIKNAEIENLGPLEEPAILGILQKEVKTRHESIEGAQRANRPDLIKKAENEIAILESFLPKPLPHEEIKALAREIIEEVGATSQREMGQVMKVLMPRVQGRADGKQVSQIVRELLQQQ